MFTVSGMTKQRAFERKLIADALRSVLLETVSPEPDLHMGDITVGWKALEENQGRACTTECH